MRNYSAKDVDSYIASSGREARPKLKEIRKIIKSTIPKVEEGISYGAPPDPVRMPGKARPKAKGTSRASKP
ncbi:MAG: hypothetical protein ACREAW_08970, partial [Nitrososphaera sp.]